MRMLRASRCLLSIAEECQKLRLQNRTSIFVASSRTYLDLHDSLLTFVVSVGYFLRLFPKTPESVLRGGEGVIPLYPSFCSQAIALQSKAP